MNELAPGPSREQIQNQILELRPKAVYNECLAGMKEAVRLADENKAADAMEKLDLLQIECKETELKQQILDLRHQVRRRVQSP